MSPIRVQRRRTKGWRAPLCSCGCGKPARYVGRGTKWGNPYQVHRSGRLWWVCLHGMDAWGPYDITGAETLAVDRYHAALLQRWHGLSRDLLPELRGHDLMCWCGNGHRCHADVLLKLANQGDPR